MKFGPQTVQGWVIFALTLVAALLVAGWILGLADIPVGVKDILLVIVGGLVGVLNGTHRTEVPPGTTVESTTTITPAPPGAGEGE